MASDPKPARGTAKAERKQRKQAKEPVRPWVLDVMAKGRIRDSSKEAKARRKAERKGRIDSAYRQWIREQGCVVGVGCVGPVHCHHEPPKSHAGCWSDYSTVGLCAGHHDNSSPKGRHALGLPYFQQRFGVALKAKALELRGRYLTERGDNA
jgi:hypothetical protein